MAGPLKVRGTCSECGKPTTQTAPTGRVTWRGPCPSTKDCKGTVLARKFRTEATPSTTDGATESAPTEPPKARRPRKVPKVGYTKPENKPPEDGNPGAQPPDVQPTGEQQPAEVAPPPAEPEQPAKRKRRSRSGPYDHIFGWGR